MEQQYTVAKASFPDAILLMRVGDFFEIFGEDAVVASRSLGITLTSRDKKNAEAKPMCGVPHHAADAYVARLLADGYRVAMCDQIEDPKQAKGLVERAITRVYTPGVVLEDDSLANTERRLLGACVVQDNRYGCAWVDFSTGECEFFLATTVDEATRWLSRNDLFEWVSAGDLLAPLRERFGEDPVVDGSQWLLDDGSLNDLFPFAARPHLHPVLQDPAIQQALLLAGGYIRHIQLGRLPALRLPQEDPSFSLDSDTVRNLEIFAAGMDGRRKGSLLHAIDRTTTAAGRRRLAEWLRRPLHDMDAIQERQEQVRWLAEEHEARNQIGSLLSRSADCQRLAVKAMHQGKVHGKDLAALRDTLAHWPELLDLIAACPPLLALAEQVPQNDAICQRLHQTLVDEPALQPGKGRVIRESWDDTLSHSIQLQTNSRGILDEYQEQQRTESGLAATKIKYNRVFGYFLELPRSQAQLAPPHWIRRQTLSNVERYVTEELERLSHELLSADEQALTREQQLFNELIGAVADEAEALIALGEFLAWLDSMISLASLMVHDGWRLPDLHREFTTDRIVEGSHPALQKVLGDTFVPNSTTFTAENRFHLLTGPNMGGKSTYLKQVGQIYLLAQIGAPVPAVKAELTPVDQIFTRVGAGDDIAAGESTFMVEMRQCAHILTAATSRSLILLDEVGRGTSTFDGLSIAWALVNYLHAKVQSRGMFATHYHELAELENVLDDLAVYRMQVSEWEGNIVFMHRVENGPTSHSYGIHVAALAGLPDDLIQQARQKLTELEHWDPNPDSAAGVQALTGSSENPMEPSPTPVPTQLPLFPDSSSQLLQQLAGEDPLNLTPLDALARLQNYSQEAVRLLRNKGS